LEHHIAQAQTNKQEQPSASVAKQKVLSADRDKNAPPTCPATFSDSLETNGIADKLSQGVKYPVPIETPSAELSPEALEVARKQGVFKAVSVLEVLVDVKGKVQEICLLKSAQFGLDAQARKAASHYRFKPATKDGRPVPYRIGLEIAFRYY
jgi:outer membrane biosynthesis protein TonB